MRALFLAPLLLLSAACSQAVADEPMPADEIAAPDAQGMAEDGDPNGAACEAAGGFLDRRGRAQTLMCVHPYADAGKACTDNQQCDGKCVAAVDDGPDGEVVGTCQADDALFGCYAEVVDGKLVRAICVD
ncbi:hypothetical protein [Croceicoccus naphthovorans]|uniref:hypothetical protein n=1 Tax=Croceicoccus naphthovorans TaxID=1348774 RepID=UPI000A969358|nr:hypothetical protein [Croceicoccus naphthovorans]MBB3990144.1 hypothetical protein [Croceicoccus naphthovorans]